MKFLKVCIAGNLLQVAFAMETSSSAEKEEKPKSENGNESSCTLEKDIDESKPVKLSELSAREQGNYFRLMSLRRHLEKLPG